MRTISTPSDERTRQFLLSMCALAHGQSAVYRIQQAPLQAACVHSQLSLQAVLDLLQD